MAKAEVKWDPALEESIAGKLDHDGGWWAEEPLPLGETLRRLSLLTTEESDYLGARMGWDVPFYAGVDWAAVPPRVLLRAAAGDFSLEDLKAIYPAPACATCARCSTAAADGRASDQEEEP